MANFPKVRIYRTNKSETMMVIQRSSWKYLKKCSNWTDYILLSSGISCFKWKLHSYHENQSTHVSDHPADIPTLAVVKREWRGKIFQCNYRIAYEMLITLELKEYISLKCFYLMYRIIQIYLRHTDIDLLDILRNNSFIKILTTRII